MDDFVNVSPILFGDRYSCFFKNFIQVPKIACHYDLNIHSETFINLYPFLLSAIGCRMPTNYREKPKHNETHLNQARSMHRVRTLPSLLYSRTL